MARERRVAWRSAHFSIVSDPEDFQRPLSTNLRLDVLHTFNRMLTSRCTGVLKCQNASYLLPQRHMTGTQNVSNLLWFGAEDHVPQAHPQAI